jgi:hypothetical protein
MLVYGLGSQGRMIFVYQPDGVADHIDLLLVTGIEVRPEVESCYDPSNLSQSLGDAAVSAISAGHAERRDL